MFRRHTACQQSIISKISWFADILYLWTNAGHWSIYEMLQTLKVIFSVHDDIIKWKHFPCYWPFVRGIHQSPVNSPHKGQWRGALLFSLICVWINGWVNNGEAGDLRCYRTHYDVTVMRIWIVLAPNPYLNQWWTFVTSLKYIADALLD